MKISIEKVLDIYKEIGYIMIVERDTIIGHRFKLYHLNPRIGNASEETIFHI